MNIKQEVNRIKSLMVESTDSPYDINVIDNNDYKSKSIYLNSGISKNIGKAHILSIKDIVNLINQTSDKNDVDVATLDLLSNLNDDNIAHSIGLNVDEPFRKKGYGKILTQECENVSKNMGFTKICMVVNKTNIPSQKILNNLGYNITNSNDSWDLFMKEI